MDKIQIKNVRSLKDPGEVALSPITLLVGENSSGKSTFLRLFPLIKQSISKRTDGPFLWAGDVDDYVDFGSFSETVTNDGASTMTFRFSFSIAQQESYRAARILNGSPIFKRLTNRFPERSDICYSITVAQNSGREYISQLSVQINHSQFEFEFSSSPRKEKIAVDFISIPYNFTRNRNHPLYHRADFAKSDIFGYTLPIISDLVSNLRQNIAGDKSTIIDENEYFLSSFHDYPIDLMRFMGQCLCYNITWEEIQKTLSVKKENNVNFIESLCQEIITNLKCQDEEHLRKIHAEFKLLFFYDFFSDIEEYLNVYFHQVHYIAPLRATAERYYRLRNLAIDEVDYQGKNLAMFLSGLSENRMTQFQKWTQKYFGFHVMVQKNGGHLSVKIALTNSGTPVNMSDTGFGYSQILPIITQLWDLSTNPRPIRSRYKSVPLVIAIEQPELHLHPALQAKLARAFLSSIPLAQKNGYKLQFLIETHSETIVNYFGMAIANHTLQKRDVSVVFFDKDVQTNCTQVHISNYDQDGFLHNWPIGFFAPKEW